MKQSIKSFCILILYFTIYLSLNAQVTISGIISNQSGEPLSGVLVEVISKDEDSKVFKIHSDEEGHYSIHNITDIYETEPKIKQSILLRNYPNPFNPSTIIYFELPHSSKVEVSIFDILGREVKTYPTKIYSAGPNKIKWSADDNNGLSVSAGLYFCRLKTGRISKVHKMMLLDGGVKSFRNNYYVSDDLQKRSSTTETFHFSMRISGETIAQKYLDSLCCSSDTTININVSIIEKATVGKSGGKVGNSNMSLEIPSGAFESDHTISFYQSYESSNYGEYSSSPMFEIEGLPDSLSKPITIKIKHNDKLEHTSYILYGSTAVTELNDNLISYDFIKASESDGYLIASLHDSIFNSKQYSSLEKKTKSKKAKIASVTKYMDPAKSEHFWIYSPWSYYNYINDLLNGFESQYKKFTQTGLTFEKYQIPTKVYLENAQFQNFTLLFNNDGLYSIYINNNNLTRDNFSKIISEFGYKLLFLRYRQDFGLSSSWTRAMILTWAEGYFSADTSFKSPKNFKGNELVFFNGIIPSINLFEEDIFYHGCGMSAVLELLTRETVYGPDLISKIWYDLIMEKSDTEAFMTNGPSWTEEVWPAFCVNYLEGDIYNVNSSVFENNLTIPPFEIDKNSKKEFSLTESYYDFSANIYQVNFNYPEIDSLIVTVDKERFYPLIFGLKYDNSVKYFDRHKIRNVDKLISDGYDQMLIVIANNSSPAINYRGLTEATATIEIKDGSWGTPYCTIQSNMLFEYYSEANQQTRERYMGPSFSATGDIDNTESTFIAFWDQEIPSQQRKQKGNVYIEYDSESKILKSIDAYRWSETTTYSEITKATDISSSVNTLKAFNLPLLEETENTIVYGIIGTNTSNFISEAVIIDSLETINESAGIHRIDWNETRGYTAHDGAYLKVIFHIYN